MHMGAYHLANVVGITAVATKRFHQDGDTCLMLDAQLQHDLVEVRSMIPTVTAGDVYDLVRGLIVAVVTLIDMNTGAIAMRNAGRTSQALRSGRGGRGHEAEELGHFRDLEGLQGPTDGVIVEWPGSHAGRHQSGGGLVLEDARHEGERLVDTPKSLAHHRVDRFTHGEVQQFRMLLGGVVDRVAHAEFVEHASDKAEVVQDLATVRGLSGHNHLL
jgi:hypothetical protein